ncbi:MAG: M55 family metallopeptidase [Emergencia sp.]
MKKIFISADIEGCCGVTAWDETVTGGKGYEEACRQMTLETAAACRAVQAAGYRAVVKDGHEDARNIDHNLLPRGTELIRGWMSSPYNMLGGLDESFDGILYIGYHAGALSSGSPLNHTIEAPLFQWVKLNGELASEFTLNAILADEMGVPSLFLSGDEAVCEEARRTYPGLTAAPVKKGIGNATWNMHPQDAVEMIEEKVSEALQQRHSVRPLEDSYNLTIQFKTHQLARSASWYPGAELLDDYTVSYTGRTPFDVTRARSFMTGV